MVERAAHAPQEKQNIGRNGARAAILRGHGPKIGMRLPAMIFDSAHQCFENDRVIEVAKGTAIVPACQAGAWLDAPGIAY